MELGLESWSLDYLHFFSLKMIMSMRTISSGQKFTGWVGFHVYYVFIVTYVFFFSVFFSVCYFRHIGHVGWDPNTGFDVSYFQAINVITLNMWECHVLLLDFYSYTFL